MPNYRLFIAIELPAEAQMALRNVQRALPKLPAVRWTNPANIHLTLQFLGDYPAARVETLLNALRSAESNPPFELTLATIGAFPNLKRPRIIWAGVTGDTAALTALHRAVVSATAALGFAAEKRPFKPHLTLGRVKPWARGNDHRAIAAALNGATVGDIATVPVGKFSLIRSQLTREGAIYTPLGSVFLRG